MKNLLKPCLINKRHNWTVLSWAKKKKLNLCFVFSTVDKKKKNLFCFLSWICSFEIQKKNEMKLLECGCNSSALKVLAEVRIISLSEIQEPFFRWKSCSHKEMLPTQPWATRFTWWIQEVWSHHPSDSPLPHSNSLGVVANWVFIGFSSSPVSFHLSEQRQDADLKPWQVLKI